VNERARVGNLGRLEALGQSVWLDYIQRALLTDGGLARLIADDGVTGVTSNPAIFERAISSHDEYDDAIARLAAAGADVLAIYETLAIEDVGRAADLLRPVYERTEARDGYVSIEVSPHLAGDTEATVREAVRIRERLDRPNVMIKVPATPAGIPAIRRLVGQGVNVNATLLFSVARYREVARAYIDGVAECAQAGRPVARVASVASFFLSRIDSLVDKRLDALGTPEAAALRGRAATACARLAYQEYKGLFRQPRWNELARQGARPQRLLWASTSTKDPTYSDVKYVEALIGPDTVNTMPPETLDAYRDHGQPAARIEEASDEAGEVIDRLDAAGIDLAAVALALEHEGVQKFIEPYDKLLAALAAKARTASAKA
jgi:transaldolase